MTMDTSIIFACVAFAWFMCGAIEMVLDVRYWQRCFPAFKWYTDWRECHVAFLLGPVILVTGIWWRKCNGKRK